MSTKRHAWVVVALLLAIAVPALALDLDEARAKGKVGERADGYVGAVWEDASDDVKQLVADVNAKRRAHYEEIAAKTGAPVDAVAALAGQKLTSQAPPGQYVNDGSGWKKK
jgi:uncharacterized protein YdbL (DUF1318 family)